MKKFILKSALVAPLFLINTSMAATTTNSTLSSANVYFGFELGYDSSFTTMDYSGGSGNELADYDQSGPTYGLYLGYQTSSWNKLNVAIEAYYDGVSSKASDGSWGSTFNWYKAREYGLSILPGYSVTDNSKLYARVGYVNAKFQSTINNIDYVFDNTPGLQLGLGYLITVSQHLGLRAEYNYLNFSTCTYPNKNTIQTSSNVVKLGLEYLLAL